MPRQYFNNAGSTLAANIGTGATSIEVQAGHGPRFGTPSVADPVRITLVEGTTMEIVEATARTGDVLTVTRAVEVVRPDTVATAYAFTSGALAQVRNTAASYTGGGAVVPVSAFGVFAHFSGTYVRGNNSATVVNVGSPNASNNGTPVARVMSNSVFGAQMRVGVDSAAAINSPAGRTFGSAVYTPATAANANAVVVRSEFGISDATFQSTASLFFGIAPTTVTTADPATLGSASLFGIGASPGDTSLSVFHCNGGGTVTKVSLGSNFPANTTNTDWYVVEISRTAGAYAWSFRIRNITNGQSTSGTIAANVPNTAVESNIHLVRSTLAGTTAVSLDYAYLATAQGGSAVAW